VTDIYGKAWPYRRIAAALAVVAILSGLTFATLWFGKKAPAPPGDEDVSATIEHGDTTEVPEAAPPKTVPLAAEPSEAEPDKESGAVANWLKPVPPPPDNNLGIEVAGVPPISEHTGVPETPPRAAPSATERPETGPPSQGGGTTADRRKPTPPPPIDPGIGVAGVPDVWEDTGVKVTKKAKSETGTEADPGAGAFGTDDNGNEGGGEVEELTLGDQRVATQFMQSNGPALALLGSFITFLLTSVGSLTTIIIGWRQERRHDREWMLKVAQLELQMNEQKQSIAPRGSGRRKGPPVKG